MCYEISCLIHILKKFSKFFVLGCRVILLWNSNMFTCQDCFVYLKKKKKLLLSSFVMLSLIEKMDWYSYLIWPYCTNPITHQIMKSWSINWQLNALLRKYLTISPWYEYIFMVILHTQCLTQYYLFQKNSIESSCTLLRLWN